MGPFDKVILDLGRQGETPESIIDLLGGSMARLIASRHRSKAAQVEMARQAMLAMQAELERIGSRHAH